MALRKALTSLLAISGAHALTKRGLMRASMESSTLSGEWKACLDAEAADVHFWTSQWNSMESELLQLQEAAGVQPSNTTGVKKAKSSGGAEHFNPLAGLKINLNPKSSADLIPALSMLKSLYEDGKERIGKLNAREQESKEQFAKRQVVHDQRIATINARVKNGTLSKEFGLNETRDENRLFKYWSGVRERQHHQYHTSLKIQHGTLKKEKDMIDVYEKTIAGTESKKQLAKEFAKVAGPAVAPEIVFLQEAQKAVAQFCQEELLEVRNARASVLQTDARALSN